MISNLQLSTSETIDNLHNYTDLVVFTATLYLDDANSRARFPACRRTLERARDLGLQVVLADNGSTSDFLNIIRSFSNVILLEYPKGHEYYKMMNPPRREALKRALNDYPDAKFFLWMEPEKTDLITHENFDRMLTPMRNGSAQLVVPTPKPKDTRPEYMRMIENRANRRINTLIKTGGFVPKNDLIDHSMDNKEKEKSVYDEPEKFDETIDRWFGPQLMTREIAHKFFLAKNLDNPWGNVNTDKKENFERQGWHIASGAIATKFGYPTKSIPVIFDYPQEQKIIESDLSNRREYLAIRITQYVQILREYRRQVKRITEL